MKIKFKLFVGILVFIFLMQYAKIINAGSIIDLQENDLVLGDLNAPITMIEYASLSCPHCADFLLNTLPEIKKDYIDTGKLKLILSGFHEVALASVECFKRARPDEKFRFEFYYLK